MTRPETTIDITVMICTWNNPVRLDLTLAALRSCRIPAGISWEIVVVNNDCGETTDNAVAAHRHTLPIVLAHEPVPGLSRARNRGLRIARGKLIVFTDDDVTVNEGWLDASWEAYAARSDCFLGGPIRSQFDGRPPDPRVLRFAPSSVKGLNYGPRRRVLEVSESFIGPNWACPRALLDKVGGFDESRGLNAGARRVRVGEETDLMRRLQAAGACAVYLPDALLDHHVPQEKATLTHVARRVEAAAYDGHLEALSQAPVAMVLGYPRWRVRGLLEAGLVTAWRRIVGGDWIASYMVARRLYGVLRATRDAPKHRARAVGELPPTAPSGLETK
jgi:glycosyltransferase involved in cell wall biosynthesis